MEPKKDWNYLRVFTTTGVFGIKSKCIYKRALSTLERIPAVQEGILLKNGSEFELVTMVLHNFITGDVSIMIGSEDPTNIYPAIEL